MGHGILLRAILTSIVVPLLVGCASSPSKNARIWNSAACAQSAAQQLRLDRPDGSPLAIIERESCIRMQSAASNIQRQANLPLSQVLISDSLDLNAYATNDKDGSPLVVVNLGMLQAIGSDEDAWAGLFGHEVAHLVRRHGASRKEAQTSARALGDGVGNIISHLIPGLGGWALGTVAGTATQWATYGSYTRPQEAEADALGVEWMTRAGYDPEGAIRLMAILKQHSQGLPAFLSTHPATADREGAIRTLIAAHAEEWKLSAAARSAKHEGATAPGAVGDPISNRTATVYEER